MNTLILPDLLTENLIEVTGFINLSDEEQQLAMDEQLMLDREAYYQDSQY
ncbi:hypothetical protein [Chamaesiphon sp. VAR_48_metabat_135_sub]|jgi:hypothetical protein|nr:hypothetical protein [Chamaesiphon sp. VAR_48_metabat_135_sub]